MTLQLSSPTTKPVEPRPQVKPAQPSQPSVPMTPFTKPANPDEHQCPHIDPKTGLPTCSFGELAEFRLFS